MKTTLSKLMIELAQMEKDLAELRYSLSSKSTNTKTIELDGTEQILEEHLDFKDDFDKLQELTYAIAEIKGIISKQNNTIFLKNGKTIQESLILLGNLRSFLDVVNSLANRNSTKTRNSENTHSYFLCKDLTYNKQEMKLLAEKIKMEIHDIETEISELNSTEFELN